MNRPVGLVVHPAAVNWTGTLLNGLLYRYPTLANVPRAGIVHRLDKDTSGLMVVAKTILAQTDLVRQLQERSVSREYMALVWGSTPASQTIDAPIGRHPKDRIKMAVLQSQRAKMAVTHYETIAQGYWREMPVSLVKCRLETGRTHQIRVHMQSIGYSLVGDPLYGRSHLAMAFSRQALHACRLGLVHPVTQKPSEWKADLPDDMQELLATCQIIL